MFRRLVFTCLVAVTAMAAGRSRAAQPQVPSLLLDAQGFTASQAFDAAAGRPDTLQARFTRVNLAALDAEALDVEVAPGRVMRAELERRTTNPDGSNSWSGHIAGEAMSSAVFVRAGGILQGSLRTLGAAYSIEPLGASGDYVIREVDADRQGLELPPLVPAPGVEVEVAADSPIVAADDGSLFDLLVAYTPAARDAAGGDAAMLARINLGVTETNAAYASSGIVPRLRLVGAELITYTESGNLTTDLNAVTGTSDGSMDTVHARRNAVGADLVKLVVGEAAGGACGVAWLMTTLSSGFAANAFSVTAYPCISPNYTFGHEIGHNLGSNHAPDDSVVSNPLYSYSFGYKHPGNLFRTVMAYNCGAGCPRVLYFSNPAVLYSGNPTGTVAGHNNALSINNARNTVANWRQAVTSNTAPTITAIANRTTAEDTATPAIGFTVGDAQTPAGSLTIAASSSSPAVVANTPAAFTFGGTGASRSLVVTPQPDASGSTTIAVSVSDGTLTTSTTFQLTVTAVNDPPVIAAIGARTTAEDQPLPVSFTIGDPETAASALVVQAGSSNTALVNAAGIAFSGTGASRTLTLTPLPDQSGTTTISVSVSDGMLTTQTSFILTVSPANDGPAFLALPPLISTTTGAPAIATVTVSDVDSPGAGLALAVASANPLVLPPAGITVVPTSATTGTRTFQVTLTPPAGQTGTSMLTFTAGDGSATTAATVAFNVTATTAAPDPPTTAVATADGTSVTIVWTPALTGTAPSSFTIEIGTSAGTTTLPTQSVVWPTSRLTLSLPAGTYYTRVRAVNGIGTSAPSPEASVTVIEPSPIPGPPGNFSARTTGRTVSFTWTASPAGAAPMTYVIEAGSAPGLGNLARLETGTPATAFEVANVPPGTYWVRVRGSNTAGVGAPSQDVAIVMGSAGGCVGLPGAPVLLTPVLNGANVALSWHSPVLGGLVTSYVIQAGSSPGAANLASFNTGNASTSFAASAPAGLYYVRVSAANQCGVGPPSNEVSFTLGADRPGAPQDLAWLVSPERVVTLSWSAPTAGTPTAYLIEAGSAPGLADVVTISTGSPARSFTGSAQPGTYYVRVRAVNGSGPGAASAEVVVTVP